MRADRLVAILLMLQRREQVTAAEVAEELEISERTARRDLDALAMSGVPVYSQQGRGGGWRLAGGGRIDLSGLSADEARALFVLAGPQADVSPEVRSALRKLVRALPESMRTDAETAARSLVVDPDAWDGTRRPAWRPPHLDDIESAVVDGECVELGYSGRSGEPTRRVVHPLGIAKKGRNWYLVADTDAGMRTFRIDRVTSVTRTGEPVVRPEGFELSAQWSEFVDRVDQMRTPVTATATAIPEALQYLRVVFGARLSEGQITTDPTTGAAIHRVEIRGATVRSIATELAGFGGWVTVDSPVELIELLVTIGEDLVRTHRSAPTGAPTGAPARAPSTERSAPPPDMSGG